MLFLGGVDVDGAARFRWVTRSPEDPAVIKKILTHLNEKAAAAGMDLLPHVRAPPRAELFD